MIAGGSGGATVDRSGRECAFHVRIVMPAVPVVLFAFASGIDVRCDCLSFLPYGVVVFGGLVLAATRVLCLGPRNGRGTVLDALNNAAEELEIPEVDVEEVTREEGM